MLERDDLDLACGAFAGVLQLLRNFLNHFHVRFARGDDEAIANIVAHYEGISGGGLIFALHVVEVQRTQFGSEVARDASLDRDDPHLARFIRAEAIELLDDARGRLKIFRFTGDNNHAAARVSTNGHTWHGTAKLRNGG